MCMRIDKNVVSPKIKAWDGGEQRAETCELAANLFRGDGGYWRLVKQSCESVTHREDTHDWHQYRGCFLRCAWKLILPSVTFPQHVDRLLDEKRETGVGHDAEQENTVGAEATAEHDKETRHDLPSFSRSIISWQRLWLFAPLAHEFVPAV